MDEGQPEFGGQGKAWSPLLSWVLKCKIGNFFLKITSQENGWFFTTVCRIVIKLGLSTDQVSDEISWECWGCWPVRLKESKRPKRSEGFLNSGWPKVFNNWSPRRWMVLILQGSVRNRKGKDRAKFGGQWKVGSLSLCWFLDVYNPKNVAWWFTKDIFTCSCLLSTIDLSKSLSWRRRENCCFRILKWPLVVEISNVEWNLKSENCTWCCTKNIFCFFLLLGFVRPIESFVLMSPIELWLQILKRVFGCRDMDCWMKSQIRKFSLGGGPRVSLLLLACIIRATCRSLRLGVVERAVASESWMVVWFLRYPMNSNLQLSGVEFCVFSLLVISWAIDVGSMQVGDASQTSEYACSIEQ